MLFIKEEGNCVSTSTRDELAQKLDISENQPNPFSSYTTINVNADQRMDLEFGVFDLMGRQLFRQDVTLLEGSNTLEFDGSHLPNGMYLYSLSDGKSRITKKMVVHK